MAYDRELADRVREWMAAQPGVSEKSMFGGLAFLLDGHLAVSASSRGGLLLRVDPAQADTLTATPGVALFTMRGRDMDGWLHIVDEALRTDADLSRWLEIGVTAARSVRPADSHR